MTLPMNLMAFQLAHTRAKCKSLTRQLLFLFEDFETRGIPAEQADGNALFEIRFLERFAKLLWVEDGFLVEGRDDVAGFDAFSGRNRIFFDRDHNDPLGHRYRKTVRDFASQGV